MSSRLKKDETFWLNKTRYNQPSLDYKTIKMSARLLNYFEKEIL